MKLFLALVGGFVASLGMFVFGLVFATSLLTAEPVHEAGPSVDVAGLWTEEPRKVDTASQDLERLPALPSAPVTERADTPAAEAERSLPRGETIVSDAAGEQAAPGDLEQAAAWAELSAAHVEWCSRRYRSYDVGDNSYTPYSGGRRPCVSPFSGEIAPAAGDLAPAAEDPQPSAGDAVLYAGQADGPSSPSVEWVSVAESGFASPDHVAECFSRYRSYRPEDNTYQPYGGGPRRQCR